MAIDYVAIEEDVVVDKVLGAGALPANDADTFYEDVTDLDPQPEVGWFYEQQCRTFSEDPPVIPDGEDAPPFVPGGLGPNPGDPNYPGGPGSGGGVEPYAPTTLVLIPFHGDGKDTLTIPACPAALTELVDTNGDPIMRTAFLLGEACSARMQAFVVEPCEAGEGPELVAGYIDDMGDPQVLSPEGTGPVASLAAAGSVEGPFLNIHPDAQGDRRLTVLVRGGDDATDVVLGNVSLLVELRTSSGRCFEYEEELPDCGDCPLEPGLSAEDLSNSAGDPFEDISEWVAQRTAEDAAFGTSSRYAAVSEFFGPAANDGTGALTDTEPFACNPTMESIYSASSVNGAGTVGYLDQANACDDITVKLVSMLPADFDIVDLDTNGWIVGNEFDGFAGLYLLQIILDNAGTDRARAMLRLRDGHVYFVWSIKGSTGDWTHIEDDLGTIADWSNGGVWRTTLLRAKRVSTYFWAFTVTQNNACDEPVEVFTGTRVAASNMANAKVKEVYALYTQFSPANLAVEPRTIRWAQIGLTTNAADYGLTP